MALASLSRNAGEVPPSDDVPIAVEDTLPSYKRSTKELWAILKEKRLSAVQTIVENECDEHTSSQGQAPSRTLTRNSLDATKNDEAANTRLGIPEVLTARSSSSRGTSHSSRSSRSSRRRRKSRSESGGASRNNSVATGQAARMERLRAERAALPSKGERLLVMLHEEEVLYLRLILLLPLNLPGCIFSCIRDVIPLIVSFNRH
jgi:hypothetical protein